MPPTHALPKVEGGKAAKGRFEHPVLTSQHQWSVDERAEVEWE